jgi:hypothetical protein
MDKVKMSHVTKVKICMLKDRFKDVLYRGKLRLHFIKPEAEIAPKIVVVCARILDTVTTADSPFFDQAILRFKLI